MKAKERALPYYVLILEELLIAFGIIACSK